jgi:acetyl-CoA synthetase
MKDRPVDEIVWRPDPSVFAESSIGRLAARAGARTFAEIAAKAADDPRWFWAAAADEVGLRWMSPYEDVIDLSDGIAFPHFFRGGKLNWADYTVDRWVAKGRGDVEAIWWEGDDQTQRSLTYTELQGLIDLTAGAFRALGVERGDVIGMLLPMIPEAIVTLLAAAKIGAIVAPMFSGFGPKPVSERLTDSGAELLVTCDGFPRRGRLVPLKEVADEALESAPSVRSVVVVRRSGQDVPMTSGRDVWWDDEVGKYAPVVAAEPMDAEDPCLLLYTSGSTGKPKGCVHTHSGLPFKFAQEARHGLGIDEGDRVLWLTDMGWVMGTWLTTAALTNGATAVMFEGVPDHPDPGRLWQTVGRAGATVLGLAPTAVRSLMAHGDSWVDHDALSSLRAIGSTGEPWNLGPWWWCFEQVGRSQLPIVNMSGGTECGASIVSNSIYEPIKPMAFSGPTLGMAADIFDAEGRSVRDGVGELVVREAWPGMTKALWDGPERYLDTYWSMYNGAWRQGDFAHIDSDGFWFLNGRSDDTIMLAGKRVGPAEVETVLVSDPDVIEAAAVGVPDDVKGEALVCFVVLSAGVDAASTVDRLVDAVVRAEGKTVRPRAIYSVPDLPRTRNGKVMRRIARAAYLHADVGDVTALENPQALEAYAELVGEDGRPTPN